MNWSKFLLSPIMSLVGGGIAKEENKSEYSRLPVPPAPQGMEGVPGVVGVQSFVNPPTPDPYPRSVQGAQGYGGVGKRSPISFAPCPYQYKDGSCGCQSGYEWHVPLQDLPYETKVYMLQNCPEQFREWERLMCEKGDKLTPCVVPPGHQGPVKGGCWCTSCRHQG